MGNASIEEVANLRELFDSFGKSIIEDLYTGFNFASPPVNLMSTLQSKVYPLSFIHPALALFFSSGMKIKDFDGCLSAVSVWASLQSEKGNSALDIPLKAKNTNIKEGSDLLNSDMNNVGRMKIAEEKDTRIQEGNSFLLGCWNVDEGFGEVLHDGRSVPTLHLSRRNPLRPLRGLQHESCFEGKLHGAYSWEEKKVSSAEINTLLQKLLKVRSNSIEKNIRGQKLENEHHLDVISQLVRLFPTSKLFNRNQKKQWKHLRKNQRILRLE